MLGTTFEISCTSKNSFLRHHCLLFCIKLSIRSWIRFNVRRSQQANSPPFVRITGADTPGGRISIGGWDGTNWESDRTDWIENITASKEIFPSLGLSITIVCRDSRWWKSDHPVCQQPSCEHKEANRLVVAARLYFCLNSDYSPVTSICFRSNGRFFSPRDTRVKIVLFRVTLMDVVMNVDIDSTLMRRPIYRWVLHLKNIGAIVFGVSLRCSFDQLSNCFYKSRLIQYHSINKLFYSHIVLEVLICCRWLRELLPRERHDFRVKYK